MYIVILSSLFALFLTYLDSVGKVKNGMKWGFAIVTFLGAVHYNFGSDYMAYFRDYNYIEKNQFDFTDVFINKYYHKDTGWTLLCYFFKPLGGFFMMVAVLNVIQNILVYRFIKTEVVRSWQPMAVFIYLFNASFYILNFSMMRQGFVVCVFLGIWPLIKQRKWFVALIILLICSTIHGSARVLLPFVFWGYLPIKSGKWLAIIYASLLLVLWLSSSVLQNIFASLMAVKDFQEYEEIYMNDIVDSSRGIGFVLNFIPLFVSLYYLLLIDADNNSKRLVALAAIGFLVAPFSQIIPLIGRVGMYFSILQIATIFVTYSSISNRTIRIGLLSIYVLILSYNYWIFYHLSSNLESCATFHTIF